MIRFVALEFQILLHGNAHRGPAAPDANDMGRAIAASQNLLGEAKAVGE